MHSAVRLNVTAKVDGSFAADSAEEIPMRMEHELKGAVAFEGVAVARTTDAAGAGAALRSSETRTSRRSPLPRKEVSIERTPQCASLLAGYHGCGWT